MNLAEKDNRLIPLNPDPGEAAEPAQAGPPARRVLRLPAIKDPVQRKAGANLVRFLVIVLILTLVARGTAGATLAAVETALPTGGEVVEQVRANATVKPAGSYKITVPEGLAVAGLLVEPGQKVAAGDPLARFELDALRETAARAEAKLAELEAELNSLTSADPHDGTNLTRAQTALARAEADYAAGVADAAKAIADAEKALNNAKSAHKKAVNARDGWTADPALSDGENAAAKQALEDAASAATATLASAKAALETAKAQKPETEQALARAVEDAKLALASAQLAEQSALKSAAESQATNAARAEGVRLDVAAQKALIEKLNALLAADGLLLAENAGTVDEASLPAGGKTGADPLLTIGDGSFGFTAEAMVPQAEAEKLKPGATAQVTTGGGSIYYRPTVDGTVSAISEPDANGLCKVTIKLPDADWTAGQSVDTCLVINRQSHSLTVPLSALHSDQAGYFVYAVEARTGVMGTENVLLKIPVTLIAKDGKNAAVEGALGGDMKVVTGTSKPVEEGDRVRLP